MFRPPVTVVIPVWNQWELTRSCLESLRPTLGVRDRVVVVDNGSTDATAAGLGRYPWVRVITNPANRGFAAACNQGAAWRPEAGDASGVVVFLNNDTLLPSRWLDELTAPFVDPSVGATGPRSNNVSGPQLVPDCGYEAGDAKSFRAFAHQWRRDHRGQVTPCGRLVGFALAVRRRAFDELGGFDEAFGLGGCEDDDLCRRLEAAHWSLLIAHGSFVHHIGHATFDANGVDWMALQTTNAERYLAKHGTAIGPPPLSLSACMIVKDEQERLGAALASLAGVVDEVVIYDTGSTDATVAVATEAGATVIEGYWDDDFSRARNAALEHCRGNWVLHLDADEVLEASREQLRQALESAHPGLDVLLVEIRNLRGDGSAPPDGQRALRLFRRHRLHWRERLHEQLELRPGQAGTLSAGVLQGPGILHYGYLDEVVAERDKWARNLRVAQRAAQLAPADPQARAETELSLARALSDVGRSEDALEHFRAALVGLVSPLGRRFALTVGAQSLVALGRTEEARQWVRQLREASTATAMADFLDGTCSQRDGDRLGAVDCYRRVDDLVDEDGFRLPPGTLERYLATCLVELGRWHEALEVHLRLLAIHFDLPTYVAAARLAVSAAAGLDELVGLLPDGQLAPLAAALVAMNPSEADALAEALLARFGPAPAVLGAAALFGPHLPSLRALRWSALLREADSAPRCPLVARAATETVAPLERARCAVLAAAGFDDPRSRPLLAAAMPLVAEGDLDMLVAAVAQLAPGLLVEMVTEAATSQRRRDRLIDICDNRGLIDLTDVLSAPG